VLSRLLAHPLTRGMDVDSPDTTALRRRIIAEKPMLRGVYLDWYRFLAAAIPPAPGLVLELGSGAGFFREIVPECLASEIFYAPGIDLVCDGCRLPFADGALRAVVMTDVFHHLPQAGAFLAEMNRCVRPGGVLAMVEPWVTPWGRFIFGRFHPEPFLPEAEKWEFATSGPLSGANGALPWMVFVRDRERFARLCPDWTIETISPMTPLRYLLSGGVSMRSLVPAFCDAPLRGLERLMTPVMHVAALFAGIVVRRKS